MVLILIEIWQFWLKENVRFWHIADSYGLLKVRCERERTFAVVLITDEGIT
ncbi:Uncharacterised protein [Serratia odorifera]|uniref:Uncharacterized protein n=2 Tax=Serratia odorifera TaxID=618 RepID=D4E1J7_SEROD|nr:hypothetical protein HMPREF0758_2047 [Serratia odorifera DSM 4582]VDZ57610.1 Uncharacterised protein [Serratia odorifera]